MMMSDACNFLVQIKTQDLCWGFGIREFVLNMFIDNHPKITEGLPGTSLFFAAIDVVNRSASALSVLEFRFLKQTASSAQSSDVSIESP